MAVSNIIKCGFFIFHFCLTAGEKCKGSKYQEGSYESSDDYSCPRKDDPETLTECCLDGECCEKAFLDSLQIDNFWMMVTAIIVINVCLTLTAVVVVCCFWSKCPFYNTCRANYNSADVIVYSSPKDDDPLSLMPDEEINGKGYTPLNVKIKRVEDV